MSPTVTLPTAQTLPRNLNPNNLLTIEQVCQWWQVSRKHIWELRKAKGSKRLPFYMVGKSPRFDYHKLVWYLENQEQ